MATPEIGLELPIGVTDQKAIQSVVRMVKRIEQESRKAEAAAVKANQGITRSFGAMSNQSRAQIQNVSYQLQDIFVQISGGQGAVRALSQQMPQLLGGFGALGAILGTVAAVAIPLAANFLTTGENAEALGDQIDDLNKALSAYKSAVDAAIAPMEDLWEKFGRGAEAARETYEALLEIERIKYLRDMSETVGALTEKMEGLSSAVQAWQAATTLPEWLREEALSGAATAIAQLQNQFGLTVVEANRVVMAMQALDAARSSGPASMAAASRELADQLMAAYEAGGRTNDELLAAAESAYQLSVNAQEAAQLMGDTADATVSAAGAADDAAAATANWAATMSSVRAEIGAIASALASMGGGMIQNAAKFVELNALKQGRSVAEAARERQRAQMEAEFSAREMAAGTWAERMLVRGERALAEQGLALDAQLDAARDASREAAREAAKSGGGGRKRSGQRSAGRAGREERPFFENVERDLINLERQAQLVGMNSEAAATLRARWEMLDEAKKRGITVNETLNAQIEAQAAQVGRLTGELERAEISQDQFETAIDGVADAMAGALIAGESLREGLAQVFKQIASDILNSGIRNALSSVFNPQAAAGGGGFGAVLSSLFGGFRAAGGPVDAGRAYVVGEHGPEIIVPRNAGQVIPNHRLGGGSNSQTMVIDLRGTTGDRVLDEKMRAAGQQILAQARAQAPGWIDNHNKRNT